MSLRETLKRNWNKTPLVPWKVLNNIVVFTWGAIVVGSLLIGSDPLDTFVIATAAVGLSYLFVRLSP